ncbi:putative enoyl-CoA hydratase echA8 [Halioglobus japonicus]|nr:putative enoyl-CoA hydratase echA8 [Halioglobus japonicus]
MSTVLLEKHDGYAIVTLNRPQSMNALSRELRRDFVAAFTACTEDPDIRVVILTGNGKAFCAGFDLKELGSSAADNSAEEADNIVARAMAAFDGPIIGAINGHCITGGFEMALACDILIASESARFADTHARVGMLPGWGLSQKLPRLIGLSRAREIAFTGAPVFAQQAYEWGLVNHVVADADLLPRAAKMAQDICCCVPAVLSEYQVLIKDGYSMSLEKALLWEENRAIQWAKQASASAIEERRQGVLAKGRSERD